MRPLALLTSLQLLGCSMAMAIVDPSAMEVRNASGIHARDDPPPGTNMTTGPYCSRYRVFLRNSWNVRLPGFENKKAISEMCSELWRALSPNIGCVVSSPHSCEAAEENSTVLHWYFHTSRFCTMPTVGDAVAVGTRFKYGDVLCYAEN